MGCIYFIRHKGQEPIKIGLTSDTSPEKRMKSAETYSPWGIELVDVLETSLPVEMEKIIHSDFKEKRMNGEWFNISFKEVKETVEKYSNMLLDDFIHLINIKGNDIPNSNRIKTLIHDGEKRIQRNSPYKLDGSIKRTQSQWVIWKCKKGWSKNVSGQLRAGCGKFNLAHLTPSRFTGKEIGGICSYCAINKGERTIIYYSESDIVCNSLDKEEITRHLNILNEGD